VPVVAADDEAVEALLRDIVRVGKEAIVSFPNFAYWPHRVALLKGRMPVSESLPYEWYDTPNLRCATINDFRDLAEDCGLEVMECVALAGASASSSCPTCAAIWPCSDYVKSRHPALV
jgi:methionine biosynthesis protein MetW